ncbi:MAG TPA: aldose 1-epimerase [Ramlibacter sp.]|nr:aldose 1-epimerase [Ramlibacter sp.]
MHIIELAQGELRAEIAPEVGGAIAAFWSDHAGRRVDWLRPATEQALASRDPLSMGSFPLVPFCDRIRDGRASFEGREIHFPLNHPHEDSAHPLHGMGWLLPWMVLDAGPTHAELALDMQASLAWPWSWSARQRFELTDQGLQVDMRIVNQDDVAMPAGIGHHPCFPHTPGTRLAASMAAIWTADHDQMPVALEEGGLVDRLRDGVTLAELDLGNNFVGWGHEARIDWPADSQGPARHLLMKADAPLDYFALSSPRGFDHFCAAPVSQCADWLNLLPSYGPGPLGGARVAAGAFLAARFSLHVRWS